MEDAAENEEDSEEEEAQNEAAAKKRENRNKFNVSTLNLKRGAQQVSRLAIKTKENDSNSSST